MSARRQLPQSPAFRQVPGNGPQSPGEPMPARRVCPAGQPRRGMHPEMALRYPSTASCRTTTNERTEAWNAGFIRPARSSAIGTPDSSGPFIHPPSERRIYPADSSIPHRNAGFIRPAPSSAMGTPDLSGCVPRSIRPPLQRQLRVIVPPARAAPPPCSRVAHETRFNGIVFRISDCSS